jgi:hypothetical protein
MSLAELLEINSIHSQNIDNQPIHLLFGAKCIFALSHSPCLLFAWLLVILWTNNDIYKIERRRTEGD